MARARHGERAIREAVIVARFLLRGEPDAAQGIARIVRRDHEAPLGVGGRLVGVARTMPDPDTAARPHYRIQRGGPLASVADRLRNYNFDVVEKDLSGQYSMQAQMQGMPAPPEPSDADIKDAIWVMLPLPQGRQQMPMPTEMGPKLAEHLKSRRMLVVLDNCEHVIDAAVESIDALLGNCGALKIVATSPS